ncbi:MAG: TetR family transcriptional regulator C-terminal domain-containing protein [Paracoccaceae bacterium]|nr:TetR family transcriptional regulator C-terminal domain-containing protein [Paracoccaceae bacterium]
MPGTRRKFRREGEAQRQGDLIEAALDLMAEGGPQAATVRAIAERAGVTPGLIRHYFRTKEDLLAAAYAHFVEVMTANHRATLDDAPDDPLGRLARFVTGALRPPLTDARTVGIWAGFLHLVQREPGLKQIHRTGYRTFRGELESLIAAVLAAAGRPATAAELEAEATAVNALIDGLWLEGSVLPEDFSDETLPRLGLKKTGALLGVRFDNP